jgi:hypothetical protein
MHKGSDMNLDFQMIENGGIGKLFAISDEASLPVGQLFYKINDENKNVVIDYIYIPRKHWSQEGIKESLLAELQHKYPDYVFSMSIDGQKQASILKEAPARSKAKFRYMQGICNGSIEPPEGMTKEKACEFVKHQKNYKELPEKKQSKKLRIPRKGRKEYTHLNAQGEPCNCHFYDPEYKESKWKQVTASKLDKIIKDDPKVLRTDEGLRVLDWMKELPESVDDLLPWIVREYKKRRLTPEIDNEGLGRVMWMAPTEQPYPPIQLDSETLGHWADWFKSKSPTRRGVDIMQLTTEDMVNKIGEWDEELAANMDQAVADEGAGEVVYRFPDGWTIRDVRPEECGDEGEQMGHCVGSYAERVRRGDMKILSLRDPSNNPHVTMEVLPDGTVNQIQGKENQHPVGKYRRRIRTFIEDPQGFRNVTGLRPSISQERIYNWKPIEADSIESFSLNDESLPLNEEEFDPRWDDGTYYDDAPYNHPAGDSTYGGGIRGQHYGIPSSNRRIDYDSILSHYIEGPEKDKIIDKLYQIASARDEIPALKEALLKRKDEMPGTGNGMIKIFPDFNDQTRGGWRDIFERQTGVREYSGVGDQESESYQQAWNKWIESIYSTDYSTLIENLVALNVRDAADDREVQHIRNAISSTLDSQYVRNRLQDLVNNVKRTEEAHSYLRPRFNYQQTQPEEQMSLISKWKVQKWKVQ